MIDSKGNKIATNSDYVDIGFLAAEIKFLSKNFHKAPSEKLATEITEAMLKLLRFSDETKITTCYLLKANIQSKENYEILKKIIQIMENYTPKANKAQQKLLKRIKKIKRLYDIVYK